MEYRGEKMDRPDWLKQMRRDTEKLQDIEAPGYDDRWGFIESKPRLFVERFLSLCPPEGLILDAPCGTGKYWQTILDAGRTIVGVDQSQGMLDKAKEKFPDVPTQKLGLQELDYHEAFQGALCVDALEFITPEDWLVVLRNLYRAIKPRGYLYFTVETADEKEIESAFATGKQMGLPIVYGETYEEHYHYYPKIDQVNRWMEQAGFSVVEEAEEFFSEAEPSWNRHHFLMRKD